MSWQDRPSSAPEGMASARPYQVAVVGSPNGISTRSIPRQMLFEPPL
jgi:hypothetical protein